MPPLSVRSTAALWAQHMPPFLFTAAASTATKLLEKINFRSIFMCTTPPATQVQSANNMEDVLVLETAVAFMDACVARLAARSHRGCAAMSAACQALLMRVSELESAGRNCGMQHMRDAAERAQDAHETANVNASQLVAFAAAAVAAGQRVQLPATECLADEFVAPTLTGAISMAAHNAPAACGALLLDALRLFHANIAPESCEVQGTCTLSYVPTELQSLHNSNNLAVVMRDTDGAVAEWLCPEDFLLTTVSAAAVSCVVTCDARCNRSEWRIACICAAEVAPDVCELPLWLSVAGVEIFSSNIKVVDGGVCVLGCLMHCLFFLFTGAPAHSGQDDDEYSTFPRGDGLEVCGVARRHDSCVFQQ